jgi:hypothetical protein
VVTLSRPAGKVVLGSVHAVLLGQLYCSIVLVTQTILKIYSCALYLVFEACDYLEAQTNRVAPVLYTSARVRTMRRTTCGAHSSHTSLGQADINIAILNRVLKSQQAHRHRTSYVSVHIECAATRQAHSLAPDPIASPVLAGLWTSRQY